MTRDDVVELIKQYLSIEVRVEYIDYPQLVKNIIDLKFDGEVISSVELE